MGARVRKGGKKRGTLANSPCIRIQTKELEFEAARWGAIEKKETKLRVAWRSGKEGQKNARRTIIIIIIITIAKEEVEIAPKSDIILILHYLSSNLYRLNKPPRTNPTYY